MPPPPPALQHLLQETLCFCGSYDGDLSKDNLKLDGSPAEDVLELGSSWQMAEDEDKE